MLFGDVLTQHKIQERLYFWQGSPHKDINLCLAKDQIIKLLHVLANIQMIEEKTWKMRMGKRLMLLGEELTIQQRFCTSLRER